jgi:hypothetical protein
MRRQPISRAVKLPAAGKVPAGGSWPLWPRPANSPALDEGAASARLMARGGVPGMTVHNFWVLEAPELWAMGYRRCAPEHAPMMKRR